MTQQHWTKAEIAEAALVSGSIAGLLLGGAWSIILIIPMMIAAAVMTIASGFSALSSVPDGAAAIGAASIVLVLSLTALMRQDPRERFLPILMRAAMVAGVFILMLGLLSTLTAAMTRNTELPPNLADIHTGISTLYAWLVMVVIPVGLALTALFFVTNEIS